MWYCHFWCVYMKKMWIDIICYCMNKNVILHKQIKYAILIDIKCNTTWTRMWYWHFCCCVYMNENVNRTKNVLLHEHQTLFPSVCLNRLLLVFWCCCIFCLLYSFLGYCSYPQKISCLIKKKKKMNKSVKIHEQECDTNRCKMLYYINKSVILISPNRCVTTWTKM